MYGYLFSKSPLVTTPYCSYVSIVVAQETGYNIKFTRCKVFKIPLIERVEEIDVDSKINFKIDTITKDGRTYHNIVDIGEEFFVECHKCLCPTTGDNCDGCVKEPAKKLDGVFTVRTKWENETGVRYFLESNQQKVMYNLFCNSGRFEEWKQFKEKDKLLIRGWEGDNQFCRIRYISKVL